MADAAKSNEIRDLWIELAKQWRQKAEFEKRSFGLAGNQERRSTPNFLESSARAAPDKKLEVRSGMAPKLAPGG
jgi:hypothetical protein